MSVEESKASEARYANPSQREAYRVQSRRLLGRT